MPEKATVERSRKAKRAGRAPTTQAETAPEAGSVEAQDEQPRSTDESGDRIASRQDVEKLRKER